MFGIVRKKKVLEYMKSVKDSNRKENLYAKYPPETEREKALNSYSQGFEDGTDNLYNAVESFLNG